MTKHKMILGDTINNKCIKTHVHTYKMTNIHCNIKQLTDQSIKAVHQMLLMMTKLHISYAVSPHVAHKSTLDFASPFALLDSKAV